MHYQRNILIKIMMALVFLISGCDDVKVRSAYSFSDMQDKIRKGKLSDGDVIFPTGELKRLCFIYPNVDLNDFTAEKRAVNFSEEYFFVLSEGAEGEERVAIIHDSYIRISGGNSLCANTGDTLIVDGVEDNGRIIISMRN